MTFIAQPGRLGNPNGEFLSGVGTVYRQAWTTPAAPANTGVLAATTCPSSGTTVVTTGITNPAVPRVVRIKGNQVTVAGNVLVKGTDQFGNTKTDTIASSGTSAVDGVIAFRKITSITIPTRGASGDTISVGPGAALGLDRQISDAGAAVISASVASTREATLPTMDATNMTAAFNTAFTGSNSGVLYYLHEDLST